MQLEEAKDANGTDGVLLTGKSITVLEADSTEGSVFVLECNGSDLAVGFGYVRVMARNSELADSGVDEVSVIYVRDDTNIDMTTANARV